MGRSRRQIAISDRQREILERLERAHSTEQQLARRVRMVLGCAEGRTNLELSIELGVHSQRVLRWRKRWFEAMPQLAAAEDEGATDKDLLALVVGKLSDRYRSGAPPKFSAEQVVQIIALACEDPEQSGLPVSHWSPEELAKEAVKRKIVDGISPRHVDRFLKGGRPAPPQDSVLAERQDQGRRPRRIRR